MCHERPSGANPWSVGQLSGQRISPCGSIPFWPDCFRRTGSGLRSRSYPPWLRQEAFDSVTRARTCISERPRLIRSRQPFQRVWRDTDSVSSQLVVPGHGHLGIAGCSRDAVQRMRWRKGRATLAVIFHSLRHRFAQPKMDRSCRYRSALKPTSPRQLLNPAFQPSVLLRFAPRRPGLPDFRGYGGLVESTA